MSELRWTLLILGVVFIAALSWWERRRPRQAFAPRLREASLSHVDPQRIASVDPANGTARFREPWIGDADLPDAVLSDVALTDAAEAGEPGGQGGVHSRVELPGPGPLEELPTLVIPDAEEPVTLTDEWNEEPAEAKLIDPEADTASVAGPVFPQADPALAEPEIPGAEGVGKVRVIERSPTPLPPSEGSVSEGDPPPAVIGGTASANEPIVEWPPEDVRRILSLRLVAPQAERFAGRTLRLALAAEGFLLGKFAIFHKPDDTHRAVLSAASLTRPGAFDLETMDSQRYGGLSLFVVLPGPKAPREAFEDLLAAARNLNERLEGALQDERGGPLTPLRVASIRESLKAEAASVPPAAAHEA